MTSARVVSGYRECEVLTRRVASNFGLGIRLLPRDRRRAMSAVYWFSHTADQIADGPGSAGERLAGLGALRADLERALAGAPPDACWAALADTIARYQIPVPLFHQLVDGVGRDLETEVFETWDDLRGYCYGVASVVGLISLRIFGGHGDKSERAAEELGYALQLTNILRDLREDAARGRWYVPKRESSRFEVTPEAVAEGKAEPGFERLVSFQAERARAFYASGARLYPCLPRSTRACPAALAGVYRALLESVADDPRRVLDGRVALSPLAKVRAGLGTAGRVMLR